MTISVLIVGYNSAGDILQCLASIEQQGLAAPDYEILFINNSEDGAEALVREHFPAVRIIPHQGNIGFGAGCNRLAAYAKGDYLLLINPDLVLHPNSLKVLLATIKAYPEAGIWGGTAYLPSGEMDPSSQQKRQSLKNEVIQFLGMARLFREMRSLTDDVVEMPIVSGAYMAIERQLWDRVGGFDESFFLYSEEVDLCERARALTGRQLVVNLRASATHHLGASSTPDYRTLMLYKGKMHFARKTGKHKSHRLYFAVFWVYCASRLMVGYTLYPFKGEAAREKIEQYRRVTFHPLQWYRGFQPDGSARTSPRLAT